MFTLQSEFLIIKVIFVFILINIHCVIGPSIPKCQEASVNKCYYFPNKETTRREAYESCKNLSSTLSSENDIRMLIFQGELGRLWTAYNLNSQEGNESDNLGPENNNTRDIACYRQQNPPKILSCKNGKESRNITIKNIYSPDKPCVALDFYEEYHYFTSCTEQLRYFCIRNGERSSQDSISNVSTNSEEKEFLYLDEKMYKNLTLPCDSMEINVGNIQLKLMTASNKRISKSIEWSLMKQMNMEVKCFRNKIVSKIYKILPMHDLEFFIKSNSNENKFSFNGTYNPEYRVILNDFSALRNRNILSNIQFEEDLKGWKITLKSLNETALKLASRVVLKKRKYIPLFCVEETTEYGFNNEIKWDFTKGNEFQVPKPNICKTQGNDMKKRKCKVLEDQDGLPKYEWSLFDLKNCNINEICPPDFESGGRSKCIKVVTANNFESHFYNLIGIEDNILDIDGQISETENLINLIEYKGYKEVLIPVMKLEEFDKIIYVSKNAGEGYEIINEKAFGSVKNKYFSFNIDTRKTQVHDEVNEDLPYISIINPEELVKSYNSTYSFLKSNPTLKKRNPCYGYFSHYDGKCITLSKTNESKSWREALDYCKEKSLELFNIEYDFLEDNFKNMMAERNIPSVWIGHDSKSLRKKQKILTPSGREIIDSNAKLEHTACQTKVTEKISSFPLIMNLTEVVDDKGTNLCLKFSNKNVNFLETFPICYCYPNWKTQKINKSRTDICDYVTGVEYSSECQCTAAILRSQSPSVIHSNVLNFYNKSFNYYILHITLSNTTLTIEELDKLLRSVKIPTNIPISNWKSNVCHNSQLHSAKLNQNEIQGKTYVLNLACANHVYAKDIDVKETEKLINNINKYFNVSVIVRTSDGCHRDIINDGVRNLTWEKTSGEGYFQPTELCLTHDSVPVYRKCEGNYYNGYKWDSFNSNCRKDVTDFEMNLGKLKVKNITNKVSELQAILFNNSDAVTPFTVYAVSDILSKTDRKDEFSVSKVINIVNSILESPVKNITNLNTASNVSNQILTSFDELLISQVPFNFTTEQEKANNNKQFVVFGGSISEMDNKLPAAFGIKNKENEYVFSFLETIESETESPNVIVSIPESLRKKNLKLSYVYKQWKNKLFFDDPSLKTKKLEIIGDIIDVSFVNLKNRKKIEYINDNITIKMRVNSVFEDQPFVCVSWNLDNGSWSTDGCSESFTESKSNYISCTCNHMTHYGFLFHAQISENHAYALSIIVYLGSSISILFMLIIMISGFILRKWPKHEDNEAKTLINLCVAILGTTLSMLIGAGQTKNKVFCDIFAAALHYFLLSSFFWMSTEAFFKYLIYVRGRFFLDYKLYKRALLVSWGIPLVIGIILWSSRYLISHQPQNKKSCWLLKYEMYYYFLLPLCLFMILNLFLFFSIIYSFRKMLRSETTPRNSENLKKRCKRVIYEVIVLGFLFGLTWLFGLFLMTGNQTFSTIVAYIFSIFQSLQGTLIFVRVYGNKLFRDEWKYFFNRNIRNLDSQSTDVVSATQRSNLS